MPGMPRRAMAAHDRTTRITVTKQITSGDLANGGKLAPASLADSGIKTSDDEVDIGNLKTQLAEQDIQLYVPIIKTADELRIVTGIVLVPEQADAHGDIYDVEVVRNAAWDFLEGYQDSNTLGLMHKKFNVDFGLLESYLAPSGLAINGTVVKEGSWIMTVRVKDDKIWKLVKDGKITGFSIGGKARVKDLPTA
jgi:hypothetical protein